MDANLTNLNTDKAELSALAASTGSSLVGFLQSGTGAVASTLLTKARESVSVKDFGAVGDGVTDDTTEIQLAITSSPGKAIHFPAGTYVVSSTITISSDQTILYGDGSTNTFIKFSNAATDGFVVSSATPLTTQIYGVQFRDLQIMKTVDSTTLVVGLKLVRASSTLLDNVTIGSYPIGLLIEGCINSQYDNLNIYVGAAQTTNVSASACLSITSADTTTTDDPGFTNLFTNLKIGGNFVNDYGISIASSDTNSFSNCYVAAGKIACCIIQATNTDATNTLNGNLFDQVYFDGVAAYASTHTPFAVYIKSDGVVATPPYHINHFTSCNFGQCNYGIYIDEPSVDRVGVSACEFFNIYGIAISCESNDVDMRVAGNSFRNIGINIASGRMVNIVDAKTLVISDNVFIEDGAPAASFVGINLQGTIDTVSITGNTFGGVTTDFANTATITKLTISGNASTNATNTVMGSRFGNQVNADTNTLDWYEEGTFTPVLTFATPGNLSVAYTNQVGRYTRIGNRVHIQVDVITSTFTHTTASGNLKITGIPFTPRSTGARWPGALDYQGITKAGGYTSFVATYAASDPTMYVGCSGSGVARGLLQAADMPSGGTVILQSQSTFEV
jgi:acetyltransferase-like isoleucine patch superfamily enzyme